MKKPAALRNELSKRQFFRHLIHADGLDKSTIDDIEKAILHYQTFSNNLDFDRFSQDMAIKFKEWLQKRTHNGKPLSTASRYLYLSRVEKFFLWLSQQPGYKSKFTSFDAKYLHMTKKERRIATQTSARAFPTLEHILKLTGLIRITCDVDLRDRALIALTAMTGIRDDAMSSIPFGSFDEKFQTIYQNPRNGVATKFSKNMATVIFKFDDNLMNYFLEWVNSLRSKNWDTKAPLFPCSKLDHGDQSILFTASTAVIPEFWSSADSVRAIFKKRAEIAELPYFAPHTFKHFAVAQALKYCKSGEEFKAISQNFGHEHVATTLGSYGNYPPPQLSNILRKMTFSGEPKKSSDEKIDELMRLMEEMKTRLTSQD